MNFYRMHINKSPYYSDEIDDYDDGSPIDEQYERLPLNRNEYLFLGNFECERINVDKLKIMKKKIIFIILCTAISFSICWLLLYFIRFFLQIEVELPPPKVFFDIPIQKDRLFTDTFALIRFKQCTSMISYFRALARST